VQLLRDEKFVAESDEGRWPDPGFFDIMNTAVCRCETVDDRHIEIQFENGLTMRLVADSDQYECLLITVNGNLWVI
jgi:hypothetical protein